MKSFDIDVEKTILGDLLTFDSIRREILAFEEQDFAFDDHKNLFLVMKNLYNKDGNFDYLETFKLEFNDNELISITNIKKD